MTEIAENLFRQYMQKIESKKTESEKILIIIWLVQNFNADIHDVTIT